MLVLLETLRRDLLFTWKTHLNLVVHHEDVVRTNLIDLADDHLANTLGVLFVDVVLLNVANTLVEILNCLCDQSTSKRISNVLESDFLEVLVADLWMVACDLTNFFCGDLRLRVLNLFNDFPHEIDFDVSLLHVYDDVEVGFKAILLLHHR